MNFGCKLRKVILETEGIIAKQGSNPNYLEILISRQENDVNFKERGTIREINRLKKRYFVNCITIDKILDGITLLGRQICGNEPWTIKQRDAQAFVVIQLRFLDSFRT